MDFASVEYLLFFLLVFVSYWTLGRKSKNIQNFIIVISSVIFYGWWDWRFLGLLLVTVLSTYWFGYYLYKCYRSIGRKFILVLALIVNLGILAYFKYFNFFVDSFVDAVSLFGGEVSLQTLRIILPVGISFYTFTALSYIIDVYQKKISAIDDMLAYSAYVMFFPSILCGPISRAQKQLPQYLQLREFKYSGVVDACRLILLGGAMKLCLADRLGIYVDAVYSNIAYHNGTTLMVAAILYSIQIYADFAGYSLMAIGFGKMLGIDLPVNFIRPYFSQTVTEFWRRWHISLTTWFRDYIYFPLGGNRVGRFRWMINIMIVFVVSGLWHGAAYTFLMWGALHGIFMICERLIYGARIKQLSDRITVGYVLRVLVTFGLVTFAWIFFRAGTLPDALAIIRKIFVSGGMPWLDMNTLAIAAIALFLIGSVDVSEEFGLRIRLFKSRYPLVRYMTVVLLICYIISYGVLNGGSFIYFQF